VARSPLKRDSCARMAPTFKSVVSLVLRSLHLHRRHYNADEPRPVAPATKRSRSWLQRNYMSWKLKQPSASPTVLAAKASANAKPEHLKDELAPKVDQLVVYADYRINFGSRVLEAQESTFSLSVAGYNTVRTIKELVAKREGVLMADLSVEHAGKKLSRDLKTLDQLHINVGTDTLKVTHRQSKLLFQLQVVREGAGGKLIQIELNAADRITLLLKAIGYNNESDGSIRIGDHTVIEDPQREGFLPIYSLPLTDEPRAMTVLPRRSGPKKV
jgi:hypothetical protein